MTPTTESSITGETRKPLSPLGILLYSLANFGFGMFYALNSYILPLWFAQFQSSAMITAMLSDTHSVEGAIIQPIVGSWSDRLRSRFGRRKPFMLLFIPISGVLVLLAPSAATLPEHIRIGAMIACVILFTIAFNIAADPYQALLADLTTQKQRDRVSGAWYFVGIIGQVAILLAPLSLNMRFVLVAITMIVTTLVTCFTIKEPEPPKIAHAGGGLREHLSDMRKAFEGLATLRQARLYLAMYFSFGTGLGAIQPHLSRFIENITHCSEKEALHVVLALLVSAGVAGVPAGWLAGRIGVKRLLIMGTWCIAAASVGGLWVQTPVQIAVVLVLAGLGLAAQNASSFPLLTRLVPSEEVGYYTGLQTMALSIATPLSALGTGWLINHGTFRVIFAVSFVFISLSAFVLTRLREDLAMDEIAQRRQTLAAETVN